MATAVVIGRAGAGKPDDRLLSAFALAHGALLLAFPSALVVALGLWWEANTVAHSFIHRPFFRTRAVNVLFSALLSLLLGFPQSLWRSRHLAHHAGSRSVKTPSAALVLEAALVAALWVGLAAVAPGFFFGAYLPGYALGLGLCFLQGDYEHARGTVSHYGRLYNLLFLNDGYHCEHHQDPAAHWSELPLRVRPGTASSRWPAVLRWLDALSLEGLERWGVVSPRLQRYVLDHHRRAFRRLLSGLPRVERVTIVGGGLFPRTALILRELLPGARLTLVDRSAENLAIARSFLAEPVETVQTLYEPPPVDEADLVVVPLSYAGDRGAFYRLPPAPALVHDWIWRRHGRGTVISWFLLKRLNLVRPLDR